MPPPPTRFGPAGLQAKPASPAARVHTPPPTRFAPVARQAKPAAAPAITRPVAPVRFGPSPAPVGMPAPGRPPAPPAAFRPRPAQASGRSPSGGVAVQRFGAIAGAIGWLWDRFMGFDALAQGVQEGLAEGTESLDYYLFSREGFALNAHRGDQFRDEWRRFVASGEGGIHCYQDDPNGFRRRVLSKEGFIWALTEEGRLVVGTSTGVVNHSILARGSAVIGAGEGNLRLTDQERLWLEWQREQRYQRMGAYEGFGDDFAPLRRYRELRDMNLREPPARQTGTVVLDFGSGHYRPKSGWRQVLDAWQSAGFFAVVDEASRYR